MCLEGKKEYKIILFDCQKMGCQASNQTNTAQPLPVQQHPTASGLSGQGSPRLEKKETSNPKNVPTKNAPPNNAPTGSSKVK
jgi:hypothetical protein